MQAQMDDLAWENTALEDRLRAALRDQEALAAVLDEMEDEHDDALARIHVLETQVGTVSFLRAALRCAALTVESLELFSLCLSSRR
jgi:hypothetical protein